MMLHHGLVISVLAGGDGHPLAVWRAGRVARAGGWLGIVFCLGYAGYIAFIEPTSAVNNQGSLYFGGGVFVVLAVGVWRFAIYPRLTATSNGLVVRGPLLTRHVAWSQIADFRSGYYGLEIKRTRGWSVTVWAVQRANLSSWLSRSTRSDDIVAVLLTMAAEHGSPLTSPLPEAFGLRPQAG